MSARSVPYALFSRGEMEHRYARARALMAERDLDALMVSGDENFQYFTGANGGIALHHSLTRPSVFVMPREGEPIVVTQGTGVIELSSHVEDIRGYGGLLRFPAEDVTQALRDAGVRRGRVGAELGQEQRMGMPVGAYLEIVKALDDVAFVDAADVFIRLRMVKSDEELSYIRRAAQITGRARQRLYDGEIRPGMTERDAVRELARLMLEEGGDRMAFCHIQNGLPGHTNQFHFERPLERGMVIGMDSGAYYRMYTVDYPRFAALGTATTEQRRVHEAARHVKHRMAEALRPGVTCAELYRVTLAACEEADVEPADRGRLPGTARMGHGQGMNVTEPPSIIPEDQTVLEQGVVISLEPGVRGSAERGAVECVWEDTYVVTTEGPEQLTLETEELREIPF